VKPLEKAVYSAIDLPISWLTGKRTHYFSEVPAQLRGLARLGKKLPAGVAKGTKLDFVRPPLIKGVKGKALRLPTKALVWEDDFSKRIVGWMESSGKAEAVARSEGLRGAALIARKNQLLINPTEEIISAVNKEQLIRTFQDKTAIGSVVTKLPQKFLRWILPFRKTLSSILTKGLERTPFGFGKAVGRTIQARQAGLPFPQAEVVQDIGNAAMGTAMGMGLTVGILKGKVTGAPPKNKAKRDLFYAQGKQPYSIRIKDKWYPYGRLEPYGTA
ncbi:unnamed protein product, partial [marine sediment metagenome]